MSENHYEFSTRPNIVNTKKTTLFSFQLLGESTSNEMVNITSLIMNVQTFTRHLDYMIRNEVNTEWLDQLGWLNQHFWDDILNKQLDTDGTVESLVDQLMDSK